MRHKGANQRVAPVSSCIFRFSRPAAVVAATQALYDVMKTNNRVNHRLHKVTCGIARRLSDLCRIASPHPGPLPKGVRGPFGAVFISGTGLLFLLSLTPVIFT